MRRVRPAPSQAGARMPVPAVQAQSANSLKRAAGGQPSRPGMGQNNANPELGL